MTQQPQPGSSDRQSRCDPQGRRPADGQPDDGAGRGQPGQPASPGRTGQPATSRQPERSGGAGQQDRAATPRQHFDPIGDMQRWLIRSSARNMRREITGEVRRRIGSERSGQDDVWAVAVTEPPADAAEAPECAWCPVCRAARKIRERQGLGGQLSGAGEAVAAAVQEAFGAFDGLLARSGPGTRPNSAAGGGASGPGPRSGAAGRDGGAAGDPEDEPDDRG